MWVSSPTTSITSPKQTLESDLDIQRLRNLTTGRLHTEMGHIYQDIEYIVGEIGIFTHMIPNAFKAMQPYLRSVVTDERFWDGQFDVDHLGEYDIRPMNDEEKSSFWKAYGSLPHPFANREKVESA